LERLEKIFLNENMSPDQFAGAYLQLQDFLKRELQTNHGYLKDGFVPPGFEDEEEDTDDPLGLFP
jgi:hypothetical protein